MFKLPYKTPFHFYVRIVIRIRLQNGGESGALVNMTLPNNEMGGQA